MLLDPSYVHMSSQELRMLGTILPSKALGANVNLEIIAWGLTNVPLFKKENGRNYRSLGTPKKILKKLKYSEANHVLKGWILLVMNEYWLSKTLGVI